MKTTGPVFGEQSFSKIAAVYPDAGTARAAAGEVRQRFGLAETQVRLVTPDEVHPGHRIEPESRGIMRTAIKAHITFCILGALAGLALFAVLWGMGVPAITASPWMSGIVIVAFLAAAGLLVGGLVTLRPDHDLLILKVMEAIHDGRYAVIVHPVDHAQRRDIRALLERTSGEVIGTL